MDWNEIDVLEMERFEIADEIFNEEFAAMEDDLENWEDEPYTEDEMRDLMIIWVANRNY